uniref:Uncharacterized protein n=1 Tax=Lotus japonicus TaxID=34305 RepID=I3STF3_LOTJA|nr:unknown [Lotus japonicus]
MSLYIGREASKLWKRICSETTTELNLLAENWKYLLAGLIGQYIHGLAARGFIIFIGRVLFCKMLDSSFFRSLGKTKLTSVKHCSPLSLCPLPCGRFILSY